MEQEAREREKNKTPNSSPSSGAESSKYMNSLTNHASNTFSLWEPICSRRKHIFLSSDVQTLDTMQALCLPLGASISLLVMFFFFDSMQMLFAICTASKPTPYHLLPDLHFNFSIK
jgi:signal peptide peptidase-like 3